MKNKEEGEEETKYALPSAPKQFVSAGGGYGYGVGCGVGPFFGMGVGITPWLSTIFGAGPGIGAYCGVGFGGGALFGIGAMYMPYGLNIPFMFGPRLERAEKWIESEETKAKARGIWNGIGRWIEQKRNQGRGRRKGRRNEEIEPQDKGDRGQRKDKDMVISIAPSIGYDGNFSGDAEMGQQVHPHEQVQKQQKLELNRR